MKMPGFRIVLACGVLLASGCSRAVNVEQAYQELCGVSEDFFEPETRDIVRGQFNELLEAMYQVAGIDYGGDRRAFLKRIEEQLTSAEAVAFIDTRTEHYMRQLMQ